MASKQVRFSDSARERMMLGVDALADAVKVTLGPKGRNVVYQHEGGKPRSTKDGVTVAKEIELSDRFENMGAQLLREVAKRTGELVGDGTTTATVLAQAMVHEGVKGVTAGMNPMDIKRGIELAVGAVVKEIAKQSKRVSTHDEIAHVGRIAANDDAHVGELISEAMQRVGEQGVITVEEGDTLETELDVVEGMRFDKGYLSPYFATDPVKMNVKFDDAYVLLHDSKLSNLQGMLAVLELVAKTGHPLLIVAEDVEGEALAALVVNRLQGGLKVAAVKAPLFGDRRRAWLEDMAILTGGEVVAEELGNKLESLTLDQLGQAKRVLVERGETLIIGGKGEKKALDARCRQLRKQLAEEESEYEQERIQERLAKLVGGVAVLRVGGASEFQVKEHRDLVDDALNATRCAVEEGIVPGGGAALLYATRALNKLKGANPDQDYGIAVVRKSLPIPLRLIAENAGADGGVIAGTLLERNKPTQGYDAQDETYCDMMSAGIIDPAKVVRTALQDASSIAGLLIATEAMVGEEPETPVLPELPGGVDEMHAPSPYQTRGGGFD